MSHYIVCAGSLDGRAIGVCGTGEGVRGRVSGAGGVDDGCGRMRAAGAGAWAVACSRPGPVCERHSVCEQCGRVQRRGQHGCGRATRTGGASLAARALQTRLINGLWHIKSLTLLPPHVLSGC